METNASRTSENDHDISYAVMEDINSDDQPVEKNTENSEVNTENGEQNTDSAVQKLKMSNKLVKL